jgi:hypothetical protein
VTDGDLELVQAVVSWAVTLTSVCVIVVLDERRLRGVRLQRAWPPVSHDAAIFTMVNVPFGLLLVPLVHFVRTRRNASGLLFGLAWAMALVGANLCAQVLAEAAVDRLGL